MFLRAQQLLTFSSNFPSFCVFFFFFFFFCQMYGMECTDWWGAGVGWGIELYSMLFFSKQTGTLVWGCSGAGRGEPKLRKAVHYSSFVTASQHAKTKLLRFRFQNEPFFFFLSSGLIRASAEVSQNLKTDTKEIKIPSRKTNFKPRDNCSTMD